MSGGDIHTSRRDRAIDVDRLSVNASIRHWQQHGDERARTRVLTCYLPLTRRLAARYRNPPEIREDVTQVAIIGLLKAIDRFDPDRGKPFEALAIPTILGEIKRFFRDTGWTAHIPRREKELALAVKRGTQEFAASHGRSPRVEELARLLNTSSEDVLLGLQAGVARYPASLDTPLESESGELQRLGDQIGGVDDQLQLVDARLSLSAAISRLPHAERSALQLRLGEDLLQSEIAQRLGCSQMQVSRLLRRASVRIRDLLELEPVAQAGCADGN